MRPRTIIVTVEIVIISLLFVAASFYYQAKMSQSLVKASQDQLRDVESILSHNKEMAQSLPRIKSEYVKKIEAVQGENTALKEQTKVLKKERDSLAEENSALKNENKNLQNKPKTAEKPGESGDTVMAAFKEKIKNISVVIDTAHLSNADRKQLNSLLKSIYTEVNNLDFTMSKLSEEEPLYREKLREREIELDARNKELMALKNRIVTLEAMEKQAEVSLGQSQSKENELKDYSQRMKEILELNKSLTETLAQRESEIKVLQDKAAVLDKEREGYIAQVRTKESQAQEYYNQLVKVRDDQNGLQSQLEKNKKEIGDLLAKIDGMEKDKNKAGEIAKQRDKLQEVIDQLYTDVQGKEGSIVSLEDKLARLKEAYGSLANNYALAKKKLQDIETDLVKRAGKIVTIQEALENRNSSLLDLTSKFQERMKELADLREAMVKVKMENKRMSDELKSKDASLEYLQQEIGKINEASAQFQEYIGKASQLLGGGPKAQVADSQKPEAKDAGKDKNVQIEIQSVKPGQLD